jgi:hypothetical protein
MFNCDDIKNIQNISLKKLMELRCNRIEINENIIIKNNYNNYKVLLIILIIIFIFINNKLFFKIK